MLSFSLRNSSDSLPVRGGFFHLFKALSDTEVVFHFEYCYIFSAEISQWILGCRCGLTTTSFNLMPVGCLDGGRAMQVSNMSTQHFASNMFPEKT